MTAMAWARSDVPSAQLVRFAGTGFITSAVQFAVFLLLVDLGHQLANLAGAVMSSILANELHRRVTFRAGGRVTWLTAQWEGGALAVVALAATSAALMVLGDVMGEAWWAGILVITSVNAIVGLTRFVALRSWVFSRPSPAGGRLGGVVAIAAS